VSANVVLLDSGGANLCSVQAAFERLGIAAPVSADPEAIRAATHIVLPGVGAAKATVARLRENGLDALIPGLTQPLLGICVGMQVLHERSEEGATDCLGLLPGAIRRLPGGEGARIPHMGWNRLRCAVMHPLLEGLDGAWMYFVHGYAAEVTQQTLADCEHGSAFAAVVGSGRILGVQFHPERSGAAGARLLQNFLALQ
jgi:glutamine amidotransferase